MQKILAYLAKLMLPTVLDWLLVQSLKLKDWLVYQYELRFKAPKQLEEIEQAKKEGTHDEQAQKTADLFKP